MPELPEVETVRRSLLNLEGQRLLKVRVLDGRLRYPVLAKQFSPLEGMLLKKIDRLGKYLIFDFNGRGRGASEPYQMVMHLGMTGRLLLNTAHFDYAKVQFFFSHDRLVFIDVRRFGFILTGNKAKQSLPQGIDALADNVSEVAAKILSSHSQIKNVLLNQSVVSGIGNIYASEILFKAKIHPARKAQSLSSAELMQLFRAIPQVMHRAIAAKGSSISDFVYAIPGEEEFHTGRYQNAFLVYAREGKKCRRCGSIIQKIQIGQRATYFCHSCQK